MKVSVPPLFGEPVLISSLWVRQWPPDLKHPPKWGMRLVPWRGFLSPMTLGKWNQLVYQWSSCLQVLGSSWYFSFLPSCGQRAALELSYSSYFSGKRGIEQEFSRFSWAPHSLLKIAIEFWGQSRRKYGNQLLFICNLCVNDEGEVE